MSSEAARQALNVVPPRRGGIIAITTDTTARPYDLTGLALGKAYGSGDNSGANSGVYVTMQAQTANVFYQLSSATASDLDETAAIAAAGTAAFANTHGALLVAGDTVQFRIIRTTDKFLILKGAAAGIVRLWASSEPSP